MRRRAAGPGFTLLEIMLVLFLLSLLAALAIPGLARLQASFQDAADRDEILLQFTELGYKVMRRGKGGKLKAKAINEVHVTRIERRERDTDFPLPLELPEGWELFPRTDVIYLDNGICLGGDILVQSASDSFAIRLHAPYCRPELLVN